MENSTNSGDRKVAHFIVQPAAYHAVIATLGELPYKVVAGCLQAFTEGSRAVFEKPPDAGRIVDTGDPKRPHGTVVGDILEDGSVVGSDPSPLYCDFELLFDHTYQCVVCEREHIHDPAGEIALERICTGPVDNDDEEGE